MFGGANRQINPVYSTSDSELRIRPYNQELTKLTRGLCGEIGLPESDVCLFETRVAFDCVLRHKARKMGAVMDNLGACTSHINTMKVNIEKEGPIRSDFGKILNNKLEELHYMPKSFV
jgi:hypothetical protein